MKTLPALQTTTPASQLVSSGAHPLAEEATAVCALDPDLVHVEELGVEEEKVGEQRPETVFPHRPRPLLASPPLPRPLSPHVGVRLKECAHHGEQRVRPHPPGVDLVQTPLLEEDLEDERDWAHRGKPFHQLADHASRLGPVGDVEGDIEFVARGGLDKLDDRDAGLGDDLEVLPLAFCLECLCEGAEGGRDVAAGREGGVGVVVWATRLGGWGVGALGVGGVSGGQMSGLEGRVRRKRECGVRSETVSKHTSAAWGLELEEAWPGHTAEGEGSEGLSRHPRFEDDEIDVAGWEEHANGEGPKDPRLCSRPERGDDGHHSRNGFLARMSLCRLNRMR